MRTLAATPAGRAVRNACSAASGPDTVPVGELHRRGPSPERLERGGRSAPWRRRHAWRLTGLRRRHLPGAAAEVGAQRLPAPTCGYHATYGPDVFHGKVGPAGALGRVVRLLRVPRLGQPIR